MSFVTLEKVVKRFGEIEVVHGIDLDIEPGEFVVLVGPSGCGKSTTLRMVAGLEEITDGTVSIEGRVMNKVAPKDRDVAMVFQNYALYPHLNVFNNICFGLKLRGVSKAKIDEQVAEAARILSLEEYLERKPADLSGGQRQRVAMGRAIVRDPKVFLFDEPLSNLDAKLRTQMRVEVRRLHNRLKATSIYVTHDQVEAMTLADRIVVMNDGYIEQVGPPIELFRNPANTFVASFLGSPPMNLVDATIGEKDGAKVAKLDGGITVPLPDRFNGSLEKGRPVVFGVRAEDLLLEPGSDAPHHQLPVSVDLVEPLGSEAILYLHVGANEVVAKTDTKRHPSGLKDIDQVFLDANEVHLFDGETKQAIV